MIRSRPPPDSPTRLRAKGFPDSTLSVITEPDATAMMGRAGRPRQRRALRRRDDHRAGAAGSAARPSPPSAPRASPWRWPTAKPRSRSRGVSRNDHIAIEPNLEAHLPEGKIKARAVADLAGLMSRSGAFSEWQLSKVFNWPTISRKRSRKSSVIHGTRYMSRSFWPGRLLSNKPRKITVLEGGPLMEQEARQPAGAVAAQGQALGDDRSPEVLRAIRAEDDFRAALIRVMKRPGGAPQPPYGKC